jgi:hypothetical protein
MIHKNKQEYLAEVADLDVHLGGHKNGGHHRQTHMCVFKVAPQQKMRCQQFMSILNIYKSIYRVTQNEWEFVHAYF